MKVRRATMVALIVLLLSVTSACQSEREMQSPVETASMGPPTALGTYPVANAWARKWRANAFLTRLSMIIPGDELGSGPREITYWFLADRGFGPFRWRDSASITVDTQEGTVVEVETGSGVAGT